MSKKEVKVWRFFITPQTHVRMSNNEIFMFKKDHAYLKDLGMKMYLGRVAAGSKRPGSPDSYNQRKAIIKRYWDYKNAVKILGDAQRFQMPKSGAWLKFYMPMPKSWGKKKRNDLCFTCHEQTPDIDNLVKAIFDSLMIQDKQINDYRASKFWYNGIKGFIEVTLGELPPALGYTSVRWENNLFV